MELAAYLRRIGLEGDARPDLATLAAVHRRHLLAIPYENLDVQLGRTTTTDPAAAYAKIVEGGRGGWCYEMNGLLGWALGEIGFVVTRMAGGVHRETIGDDAIGNHLVLRVDLDEGPWLADVGFGDGPTEPYPLAARSFTDRGFDFELRDLGDGFWRLRNHPRGGAPSFDFRCQPADEAAFAARCHRLQTDPASPFVMNAVVQRALPDGIAAMRGKTLRIHSAETTETREIGSAEAYVAVLRDVFALDLPQAAGLWPTILARHEALFGQS